MKHFLLFTFTCLLFNNGFSQQENNFEHFKTGKFVYSGATSQVEVTRTKRKHIESYNNGKSKLILEINWINDSTYMLTLVKSKNADGCLEIGDWIKTTILNRDGNTYECSFSSENCGSGRTVITKLK